MNENAIGTIVADPGKRRTSPLKRLAVFLALGAGLLLLYALSMGPAIQMNKQGKITPETLEIVYFPLNLLLDPLGPGVKSMFDDYIMWWVGPTPPPPH